MATAITPTTSLERLQNVEKKIVQAVEMAGRMMQELGNPAGVRRDVATSLAQEFMGAMREVQVTLREEIRSTCEYRLYDHNDYAPRMAAEVSAQMVDCTLRKLRAMEAIMEEYRSFGRKGQMHD